MKHIAQKELAHGNAVFMVLRWGTANWVVVFNLALDPRILERLFVEGQLQIDARRFAKESDGLDRTYDRPVTSGNAL